MARASRIGVRKRNQIRGSAIEKLSSTHAKILLLLDYGVLAPSTHNTQPWLFKIEGTKIKIYIDFDKKIPEADPSGRDMYMSVGAMIQNIVLAAREFGIRIDLQVSSRLKSNALAASIVFNNMQNAKTPQKSQILDALVKRQNYRGFFNKDKLVRKRTEKVIQAATKLTDGSITLIDNKSIIEEAAKLTAEGLRMAYAKPAFRQEISSYINHNLSSKQHGLHGFSLRMKLPQSFIIPRIMRRKDIGSKLAILNYASFISSPAVVILSAKEDTEYTWLTLGMAMEDIMVRLTADGYAASIYAAAIEMGDLRLRLAKLLSYKKDEMPQLLFCIGKPTDNLPYSLRKDPKQLIFKTS